MAVLIRIAVVFVLLCSFGCAKMPDEKLFPGLSVPTALNDIPDFKEVPQGLVSTIGSCYVVSFKVRPFFTIFAATMGVPILGCCDILVRDGKVVKCHAYYPEGDEYIRKHELQHCKGYDDKLF